MNLKNKKKLIARTLRVGTGRVVLSNAIEEIKEAITRQDVIDLKSQGLVKIKEIKGARKKTKRKTRRGKGSIRKKARNRKRDYIVLTRKLRNYAKSMKKSNKLGLEKINMLRKKIKAREFKDLSHLKEYLKSQK